MIELCTRAVYFSKRHNFETDKILFLLFQVATLAVYFYFLAALMGAQWVYPGDGDNYETIYNLPLFPTPINGKNTKESATMSEIYDFTNYLILAQILLES